MLYDPDSGGFAELKGSGMALGIDARYDYRPQTVKSIQKKRASRFHGLAELHT
jgi:hypothetical protein